MKDRDLTASPGFAEELVNTLQTAWRAHADGLAPYSKVVQARNDLIQALTVPSVHSEDFPEIAFYEWWKSEEPDHLSDIERNPNYSIRDLMFISKRAWEARRPQ